MMSRQADLFQAIESNGENSSGREKQAVLEPFIFPPQKSAVCVICGGSFEPGPRSKITTCSPACGRERRLRYGAAYRQSGRDMRAKLSAAFGGRWPTVEELMERQREQRQRTEAVYEPASGEREP